MAPEVKEMEGMQLDEFDDLIEEIKASASDTDCAAHRPIAKALIKMLRVGKITVSMDSKLDRLLSRQPDRRDDHDRGDDPPAGKWPVAWLAKIGATIGVTIGTAIAAWQAGPAIMKAVAP